MSFRMKRGERPLIPPPSSERIRGEWAISRFRYPEVDPWGGGLVGSLSWRCGVAIFGLFIAFSARKSQGRNRGLDSVGWGETRRRGHANA